ncbi:MAG: response regulator transcription factor [Candidatus Eremiobacteraeota bacterium]|nr:response regulator transcription factor [Candidatus Eremiobacteraeota bacterium]
MEPIGARVLVVDDETAIRDMLQIGLTRAGFTVQTAADGRAGLEILRSWHPEAIILDVMLPEIDGYSLLPAIRRVSEVPIIMLSAKTGIAEKVQGLLRGADDYVAKPFDIEELVARLLSSLRRPRLEIRQTLRYGDLSIDVSRRVVMRSGRRVQLSRRKFDLLMTLFQQPERVFTRSQLLDYVWGVDRDVVPNVVETYISYLRAKIDHGEPVKLIRTMRGSGYTLSSHD